MGARQGKLKSREKTIGHWPALSAPAARIEALKEAATFASGAAVVSKKDATTFATAFARHLEPDEESDRQGQTRPLALQCRRARQDRAPDVRALDASEMSHRPDILSDWHGELYKQTPVSADHCARIIRAIYRREARRDRSLPPALPTSAIESTSMSPRRSRSTSKPIRLGVRHGKLSKAGASWLPSVLPLDRLSAGRGVADQAQRYRHRCADVRHPQRESRQDIHLPITPKIAFAIPLAVNAEVKRIIGSGNGFVFPGCQQYRDAPVADPWPSSAAFVSTVAVDLKMTT